MYDFSKKITKFHDNHIRLTLVEQGDMRKRRDLNRERIISGLADAKRPEPTEWITQGGYAQKTMTQPPEGDEASRYDIDMGVVFDEGESKTPTTMREWVRDALERKATSLKDPPVSKQKCVRVVYAEGYQCDFPVFRTAPTFVEGYELASGSEWVASDPAAMNDWIEGQIAMLSPGANGSKQLRQVIRAIKYFAKVCSYRKNLKFPSGLVATSVAIECYVPSTGRFDHSVRETLRNVANRSEYAAVYANGVCISDDKDVARLERLKNAASDAVEALDRLDGDDCDDQTAAKAWKKVFRHSYFDEIQKSEGSTSQRAEESANETELTAAGLLAGLGLSEKETDSRGMKAVEEIEVKGSSSKPWLY
ncbi:MAG: hypothetical protein R3E09_12925 [Novosphingobium sp.]